MTDNRAQQAAAQLAARITSAGREWARTLPAIVRNIDFLSTQGYITAEVNGALTRVLCRTTDLLRVGDTIYVRKMGPEKLDAYQYAGTGGPASLNVDEAYFVSSEVMGATDGVRVAWSTKYPFTPGSTHLYITSYPDSHQPAMLGGDRGLIGGPVIRAILDIDYSEVLDPENPAIGTGIQTNGIYPAGGFLVIDYTFIVSPGGS